MTDLRRVLYFISPWVAILALTLAVMSPGLKGRFLFDDYPNIVENSAIHIGTLSIASLQASIAGLTAGPLGRPVSVLSFALTHYFFGLDPFAFKAINLAIHAINGFLVAWFVALLLTTLRGVPLSERGTVWLPCWVAAIWLIHPINILPVMLVVQRMTQLSAMFMLLALIGHLKAISKPLGSNSKWAWLATSWLIFWPLSVLSKESGLLFPLYVLAITLLSPPASLSPLRKKSWIVPALVLALFIITAAMVSYLGSRWLDTAYAMRPFSLTERLMTETRVLWFYATQIVIPNHTAFGLYLDDFTLSTGILSPPTTLFAIIGWIAVLLAVVYWRRRQPILCAAVALFLVGHSLESTFLPLEIAHEYRNYVASIGLILGAGYLGTIVLQKVKLDHRSLTIGLTAITPLLVLALFTWMRANQFGQPLHGPQIEAAYHPQSARANYSAALALIKAGYGDSGDPIGAQQIRFYLQQTGVVDSSSKYGYLGLITWACGSGRLVEKQWIDDFAYRLQHTPFSPRDLELPGHMLKPLLSMPKCLSRQDAIRLFIAGADNSRLSKSLRASFLEAASDYELLVSADPNSGRKRLIEASAMAPTDLALSTKLNSFKLQKLPAEPKP
jgi:hypothetical protein